MMFGVGDPLFAEGVDLTVVLIVMLKVLVVFVFLLIATMFMVWFERKLIGDMQNRLGPNRAGPFGILQTLADALKLFAKEDLLPTRADKWVFRLAPYMAVVPAFAIFAVVPMGGVFADGKQGTFRIAGHDTFWQVADPPVGILLVLAMSSVAVYGVILAGWSSGSKYPLLGAVRGSAQMVSYEAALGLSTVAVVLVTESLSTHQMVVEQAKAGNEFLGFISLPNWNLIQVGVVPFIVFLLAATAELKRPPFDLVEAEQELVGGFHTEYSSIRFALFFVAEFMGTVTMAGIIVTLFLGGPGGPLLFGPDWIWPILWFFAKVFVFLFIFVWFRATLPRFRYDQLMDLGWKLLIPLSLGWLLLIAAIRIGDDEGWSPALVTLISGVVIIVAGVLLSAAMRTSARRREAEEVNA